MYCIVLLKETVAQITSMRRSRELQGCFKAWCSQAALENTQHADKKYKGFRYEIWIFKETSCTFLQHKGQERLYDEFDNRML